MIAGTTAQRMQQKKEAVMKKVSFRSMMSANFKRDYVAGMAIVLFLAIVVGEIALAFYIPYYVRTGSALATQESRQNMIDEFDHLRNHISRQKGVSAAAASEINLIYLNLNMQADYLRTYSATLTKEEIAALSRNMSEFKRIYGRLSTNRPYNREIKLDLNKPMDKLGGKL